MAFITLSSAACEHVAASLEQIAESEQLSDFEGQTFFLDFKVAIHNVPDTVVAVT